ncbi:hypothetical protein GCM10007053_12190 [Halioglobus pacificus]|uniref:Uncharacterized protein n=1 Tax=Parahalioglobus pacificus TaxID=930806 RepID=A0A918XG97_9GAMM|nr:hypothetical protein GCM10007053_12190 [Halioglobus pacificus]
MQSHGRRQAGIGAQHPRFGTATDGIIKMNNLPKTMNTCISAACTVHTHWLIGNARKRCL